MKTLDPKPEKLLGLRLIGSKWRLMPVIRPILQETGAELLVDVFGGSGTVVMNSGFSKRIYNDVDGDHVCFYRVLADDVMRQRLLRKLRAMCMSRQEFNRYAEIYAAGGNSFSRLEPVDRAAAIFYRSIYSFGGKVRSGGFSVSTCDRTFIKELKTYQSRLRMFARLAQFWRDTCIENLDHADLIRAYGNRSHAVLYCDPPYFGTEGHYSRSISGSQHAMLAQQLATIKAAAVVSYYEFPGMDHLYPKDQWEKRTFTVTKNDQRRFTGSHTKSKAEEVILIKR